MPNAAQRQLIFEQIGYVPTPEQAEIHDDSSRVRLVAGGEQAGKSRLTGAEFLSRFYEGQLYWLVAADYDRTRAEYNYICDGLDRLGWDYTATKHVDPGEIIIAGGFRVATKSAKDPRKLGMEAPDGILGCEASQLDYETFLRLRGRIAPKRGWMLLSGTFESSLGWYPEMFTRGRAADTGEDFKSFSIPSWTNIHLYPGGRTDPEIKALEASSSLEWFAERYGGIPAPPKGIVFTEFRNHLHTGVGKAFEFDPAGECRLFVDPGYASAYVVLVAQKRGDDLYIIDEVYERGRVTSDIITICKQKPWWNQVIGGAIDIAGTQHQAMPAPAEIWSKESGIILRPQRVRIRDGVERVKTFLKINPITGNPLLHINTRCTGLISEMAGCPNPITGQTGVYKWKMDKDGNVIGDTPEDKDNHACKALAYGLIDLYGYSLAQERRGKIVFF